MWGFGMGALLVVAQAGMLEVGEGSAAPPAKTTLPEQIHIAVAGRDEETGDATGMTVAWFTSEATSSSLVQFGSRPDALSTTARGGQHQYLEDWGYHHDVEVLGLTPGAQIYYRVGDGVTWSQVRRFTAAPSAASAAPLNVSIFGDMGYLGSAERPMEITIAGLKKHWSAVPTRQTLEQLKDRREIDLIWHVGDIGYIDDAFAHDPLHFVYEEAYNGYMNWLENLTSTIPYMVSPGNHESECHIAQCLIQSKKYGDKLNNFTAFNTRWHMPSSTSGGAMNMWYSFNVGPVHFVSLNTETDFPTAEERSHGDASSFPAGGFGGKGEYMDWLEADLKAAAAERHVRPWIIAGGHRPCCSDIPGASELFEKYGVAMYFAGHSHSYGRSLPTFANLSVPEGTAPSTRSFEFEPQAAATTYVFAGGPGCDEMTWTNKTLRAAQPGPVGWEPNPHADCDEEGVCLRRRPGAPTPDTENEQQEKDGSERGNPRSVVTSGRLVSGVLSVVSPTELRYRAIFSTDGTLADEIIITQPVVGTSD